MNNSHRRRVSFPISRISLPLLLSFLLMTGCASSLQKTPKEAIVTAMGQLYSPSGYSFTSTSNINDIQLKTKSASGDETEETSSSVDLEQLNVLIAESTDADDLVSAEDSADSSQLKTLNAPLESLRGFDEVLDSLNSTWGWFNSYISNTSAKTTGTFDFKNKRFEIIPEIEYKSKNSYSYQKVPLLLDLNEGLLFVDENPLSMFLVNSKHQGKFTSVSLKPVFDNADVYGIFKDARSALLATYDELPEESFTRLSLNASEKSLGATDKIRLTLGVGDFSIGLMRQFYQRRGSFQKHIKNPTFQAMLGDAPSEGEASINDNTEFEMISEKIKTNLAKVVNLNTSKKTVDLLLNRSGKVIQIDGHLDINGDPSEEFNYSVKTSSKTSISYNLAAPSVIPTAANTVTMKEAMDGSLLGIMFKALKNRKSSLK